MSGETDRLLAEGPREAAARTAPSVVGRPAWIRLLVGAAAVVIVAATVLWPRGSWLLELVAAGLVWATILIRRRRLGERRD